MKRIILIFVMMLLFITSACTSSQDDTHYDFYYEDDAHIFDVDYLEKYADTINAMFDYEWTLLSVEEKYVSIEEVYMRHMIRSVPMPIIRPEQYTVWTIEYHGGNGDVRHFMFDNTSDFSRQIEQYVANYIAEYYREKFFDTYTIGASSINVFGMILRRNIHVPLTNDEEFNYMIRELDDVTREYIRLLATPEGAIRLSSLTPANVFEMIPFHMRVSIHFNEHTGFNQQSIEENVLEQIEAILEDINHFTNHRLNARISVSCFTGESVRHYGSWHYIHGEQVFDLVNSVAFLRYIFESYRGVFW